MKLLGKTLSHLVAFVLKEQGEERTENRSDDYKEEVDDETQRSERALH